jgi:hypothetical protein
MCDQYLDDRDDPVLGRTVVLRPSIHAAHSIRIDRDSTKQSCRGLVLNASLR